MTSVRYLHLAVTLAVLFVTVALVLAAEFQAAWALLCVGTVLPFVQVGR